MLKDPAFFYKLGKVFEQGFIVPKINKPRFVLGEERNKRLLGLLLIGAAKLGMTSLVKLLGEPGTAKDTMTRMWLHILLYAVKHVERSYITAAALRYSKECHKIVATIKFTKKSSAGRRKQARNAIKKQLEKIDEITAQLLGL